MRPSYSLSAHPNVVWELMPAVCEPIGSDWDMLGYFVYISLTSLSHLDNDVPYLPCARLDDDFLYLAYVDWNNVKSRFEFAKMMLGINDCSHLTYSFLQIIPVRACRVKPLGKLYRLHSYRWQTDNF
uniref:Uncharacterized protein n=1 Tax=Wuchereria bancrofti TaxID=6293 RepID=A0A1I8EVI8_WUCBA